MSKTRFIVICLVVATIIIGVLYSVSTVFNDHTYVVTVTDKDRIYESSDDKSADSKYIVFTKDESGEIHVFENTDLFIRFKFNSSDIQGKLEVGNTYEVTVVGYRIPILSQYENIIKVEEK
jgi:hypothetical protein